MYRSGQSGDERKAGTIVANPNQATRLKILDTVHEYDQISECLKSVKFHIGRRYITITPKNNALRFSAKKKKHISSFIIVTHYSLLAADLLFYCANYFKAKINGGECRTSVHRTIYASLLSIVR